ncbi:MAG: VCBS repeat-containing protein [Gemmataceae bacterium]
MFRDASPLIALNPPALHSGVAVTDVDGDGRFEFVVAGCNGPNRVLRWAGSQLRDCIVPDLADISRDAVGVAAGDIDGDGREELYVLNSNRADRLFDVQPDGRWVDLFSAADDRSFHNRSAGRNVAAIDRRGVGRYGFFIANHGSAMRLFELGRDGSLADLAPSLGLALLGGGRGVLTLPVFSEHPDVFCVNEQGPNFAFRNRRNGTFVECAGELGLTDPQEHARGVTAFDFGDGKRFGLCWGNWDGPHRVMLPRENGTWKDHATPGLAFPSAVRTVIAADFDNDGHDELFFHNMGEANRLFAWLPRERQTLQCSTLVRPSTPMVLAPEQPCATSTMMACWNCSYRAGSRERSRWASISHARRRGTASCVCGR